MTKDNYSARGNWYDPQVTLAEAMAIAEERRKAEGFRDTGNLSGLIGHLPKRVYENGQERHLTISEVERYLAKRDQ